MSAYDDYDERPRRRREERPPYPPDDATDLGRERRPRARDHGSAAGSQIGKSDIPPPPLGSAMKREGSRSRVPDLKPAFEDGASHLGGRPVDAERKTGDRDRKFRERRDGYTSDEGETLREDPKRTRRPDPRLAGSEASMPLRERPRDRGAKSDGEDAYDRRRRAPRDYDRPPSDYDDRRRRDDRDYDEPRRRRPVEYGAEPIRARREDPRRDDRREEPRRDDRRGDRRDKDDRRDDRYDDRRPPRRRYEDEYDDDEDDRIQRRKSLPPRRSGRERDDDYDDRRRYPEDREPRRRRSYEEDRRDNRDRYRRDDRRDDRKKESTHLKVGNYDVGPLLDKSKSSYAALAPILTPIVMNYLKKKN